MIFSNYFKTTNIVFRFYLSLNRKQILRNYVRQKSLWFRRKLFGFDLFWHFGRMLLMLSFLLSISTAVVLNLGVVVTLGNHLSLGLSLLLVLNLLQLEVSNKVLLVLIRHHLIPGIVGVLCSSYFKGYW